MFVRRNSTLFPHEVTIEDCREAIKGVPGFKETRTGDHICFNYNFCWKETFPNPLSVVDHKVAFYLKVRRECRGIIFDAQTGKVLARKFHKFFNINELDETHEDKIDLNQPHVILEKLDGCLVAPMLVDDEVSFGTKSGLTDISKRIESNFLPRCGIKYKEFCDKWLRDYYTPMFEWCSMEQQIVVQYPNDILILTGIRNNLTGEYVGYDEMVAAAQEFNIPVAKALARVEAGHRSVADLLQFVKQRELEEGFVLRFHDGNMYKMKTEWYVQKHRQQGEHFGDTGNWQEKNVWGMVVDKTLDDVLASLQPGERNTVARKFQEDLWIGLDATAKAIYQDMLSYTSENTPKKDFVKSIQQRQDLDQARKPIYLRLFDMPNLTEDDVLQEICKVVKKLVAKKTTMETARTFAPNARFEL